MPTATRTAPPLPRRAGDAARHLPSTELAAVVSAAALVVAVHLWGRVLERRGAVLLLHGAQPLVGPVHPRSGPSTVAAVVFAGLALWLLPGHCLRARWPALLAAGAATAAVWALLLALVDGPGGLTDRISGPDEYLHDVPRVGSVRSALSTFAAGINGGDHPWTTHVAGHPPGALLTFVLLDRVGLGGAAGAAGLCVAGGALAVPAAALTVRAVAGEATARRALPFLALAPTAVWVAVSADGWFLGVTAWGVALLALAAGRRGAVGDAYALGGGVLLGAALFLSYGLVLAAVPAACAVLSRRRFRPLLVAAVGAGTVVLAAAAAGFWWLDGLALTGARVRAGEAGARPYGYFLVANVAALAVAVGPAAVAGVARLRERTAWVCGGGLAALAAADLSGLSRGEVERIWLPFTPYLLAATAVLPPRAARGWLAAQLLCGLLVQSVVRSW